jgi:hypothetical protein
LSKKQTNIRHSRRKYRAAKASDNMVAPLKKTCQLSVTRKQPPKKKTAKTTRIQRNSRMSRNNAEQQIDCCKKEQNKVKDKTKSIYTPIYTPMKLQKRLHNNNLTVMVLTKPKKQNNECSHDLVSGVPHKESDHHFHHEWE